MSDRNNRNRNYNRNNRNRNYKSNSKYQSKRKSNRDSKEKVINVPSFREVTEKQEYIANLMFDLMFSISQNELNKIILRSQGNAINTCADLVLAMENRMKNQAIPVKKSIRLNSKVFSNNRNRNRKQTQQKTKSKNFDFSKDKILSYMDVTFFLNNTNN